MCSLVVGVCSVCIVMCGLCSVQCAVQGSVQYSVQYSAVCSTVQCVVQCSVQYTAAAVRAPAPSREQTIASWIQSLAGTCRAARQQTIACRAGQSHNSQRSSEPGSNHAARFSSGSEALSEIAPGAASVGLLFCDNLSTEYTQL